jgi:miniconductance mechanosensitive channel
VESFNEIFKTYPLLRDTVYFIALLLIAGLAYWLTHRVLLMLIRKMAAQTKTKLDDIIVNSNVLARLAFMVPLLVVMNGAAFVPGWEKWILKIAQLLMLWITLRVITALLGVANRFYETLPRSKERPIKGYVQVAVIVIYIMGGVFIIGLLTGQSPWVLISGIGAMTAVILLIFKDTILSFVAGIQITGYDLLHVGDWIEMKEYGADGDVVDIALHTVKVQNWDKTITVIPTHKLTENAFKNWRGMQLAGGRRIKRALYLDQTTVRFCDQAMLARFEQIELIKDYVQRKQKELDDYNKAQGVDEKVKVNGRRMTNLGTFRAYAQAYLEQHPQLNHHLTTMARQLPPGPNGLPLEIYAFTATTEWLEYEAIQADIFDHLLSVVGEFDLRIVQNPSGGDFRSLIGVPVKN